MRASGALEGALIFVAAHALLAVFSYLVIVKDIERVQLSGQTRVN